MFNDEAQAPHAAEHQHIHAMGRDRIFMTGQKLEQEADKADQDIPVNCDFDFLLSKGTAYIGEKSGQLAT